MDAGEDGTAELFCVALHDFVPVAGSQASSCLTFRAGAVLRVFNRDESGWWDGELDGRRGWFPSNYCELVTVDEAASSTGSDSDGVSALVASNLMPILQSVDLLRNAIVARRASHWQPGTAVLIGSVKAILSATDCLDRDSAALKQHPNVGRERKHLLGLLSQLVAQARRSTAIALSPEFSGDTASSAQLLEVADKTAESARRFLSVAAHSGIDISGAGPAAAEAVEAQTKSMDQQRRAKSTNDLKAARHARTRKADQPALPSPQWNPTSSISSSSSSEPNTPSAAGDSPAPASPAHSAEHLSSMHDRLLSVIAALIGHVHAHSRSSHASSYAQLIDATRETISCVQSILSIIEAASLGDSGVEAAREALYDGTTALVTAVRIATAEVQSGSDEEDERNALLRSATAVLRAGSDCVGAFRRASFRARTEPEPIASLRRPRVGRQHTLSMLGRKATSLTYLRERYERDAEQTIEATEESFSSSGREDDLAEAELERRQASSLSPSEVPTPARRTSDAGIGLSARRGVPSPTPLAIPLEHPAPVSRESLFERDYAPQEIAFNSQGHVTGGTLRSLVERMTLHDTTTDVAFSSAFFMTFRLFTTPSSLLEALMARFDSPVPAGISDDDAKLWHDRKLVPVRLRVFNVIKTWLETHFRPESDYVVLEPIISFAQSSVSRSSLGQSAANRLVDMATRRMQAGSRSRSMSRAASSGESSNNSFGSLPMTPMSPLMSPQVVPAPIVSKSLLAALRTGNASVTDIDPLELARQLTLVENRIFCQIQPHELLGQEFSKKQSSAVNVKAMSSLSTRITGWISETVLNESDTKKRAQLLKYFVKLAERLAGLRNFNALFAVVAALNSSTIARLKKTWDALSSKYRTSVESLRRLTDHSRNYSEYRQALRTSQPPCLPFLGLSLTDLTFCYEGNRPSRISPLDSSIRLINFDRYQKLARIISDLQRFQVPFSLAESPEIQAWLSQAFNSVRADGDVDRLYRRSLLIEPRQNGGHTLAAPTANGSDQHHPPLPSSSGGGLRLGTDLLGWRGRLGSSNSQPTTPITPLTPITA